MRELDLRMFDDPVTYSVTCVHDSNILSVEADKEAYEKNEVIDLDIEAKPGYDWYRIIVTDSAGTRIVNPYTTQPIKMRESDTTITVLSLSQYKDFFIVREPVMIDVNGKREYIQPSDVMVVNNGELGFLSGKSLRKITASSEIINKLTEQGIIIRAKQMEQYKVEAIMK